MVPSRPTRRRVVLARNLLVAAVAVMGCSADPRPDDPVDASVADAPPDAACGKPVVFINGLQPAGADYTNGPDDAINNVTSLIMAPAHLGPMAVDLTPEVIAAVQAKLEPMGIRVTGVDPGTEPHFEIVLVGSDWPLDAQIAATTPFRCGGMSNAIAMINVFPGRKVADIAGSAIYLIGALNGLEQVNLEGNCMHFGFINTDCTFSTGATIFNPRCNATTNDQIAMLEQKLGCD